MLRPALSLLAYLHTAFADGWRRPCSASPRRAWRRIPVPDGPAAPRYDRRAWGAIRARLGALFGEVPA